MISDLSKGHIPGEGRNQDLNQASMRVSATRVRGHKKGGVFSMGSKSVMVESPSDSHFPRGLLPGGSSQTPWFVVQGPRRLAFPCYPPNKAVCTLQAAGGRHIRATKLRREVAERGFLWGEKRFRLYYFKEINITKDNTPRTTK